MDDSDAGHKAQGVRCGELLSQCHLFFSCIWRGAPQNVLEPEVTKGFILFLSEEISGILIFSFCWTTTQHMFVF